PPPSLYPPPWPAPSTPPRIGAPARVRQASPTRRPPRPSFAPSTTASTGARPASAPAPPPQSSSSPWAAFGPARAPAFGPRRELALGGHMTRTSQRRVP